MIDSKVRAGGGDDASSPDAAVPCKGGARDRAAPGTDRLDIHRVTRAGAYRSRGHAPRAYEQEDEPGKQPGGSFHQEECSREMDDAAAGSRSR